MRKSPIKPRQKKSPAGKKSAVTRKRPAGKKKTKELNILVAFAAMAALFLSMFLLRPADVSHETGDVAPGRAYRYAVDISHNNPGRVVWDSLRVMLDAKCRTTKSINKANDILPVSYVIMKASEGITLKDNKFPKHWKEAEEAGYGRGAYHFFRSSKNPETQARQYIRTVGRLRDRDLPPILDIETIHKGCTKKELNARALTWLKTVEAHYGRTPVVYSNESFIRDMLSDEIRKHYLLWVAHYREEKPELEGWAMWQFTDRAAVYGIDGLVDLNVLSPDYYDELSRKGS